MSRLLRRPLIASLAVMGGLLVVGLIAVALGADAVTVVFVAAVVAVAFMTVVGLWFVPARKEARRQRKRERRIAKRRAGNQMRKTRRIVARAELRLYHQLEALAWLRAELDLEHPLPATRGFAAAPDALLELVRIIDRTKPRTIVDLGSGVSTLVMARRLQQAGGGRVVAIDHLPEYADRTRAQIAELGLEDVASVVTAPLADVTVGQETWSWYRLGDEIPAGIDLLFVDGPPGSTGPLARYPALPLLREQLSPGAVVFTDDGDRDDEKEMARRWAAEIEGAELRYLHLVKGAWLLTLPEPAAES